MAKKTKIKKYSVCNMVFVLLAALSVLSLFLPYISGEAEVIPANFLNGTTSGLFSIFGLVFALLKVMPAIFCFVVQLFPADIIKKYVVTFCGAVILAIGEMLSFIITTQRFDGKMGIGFILGILAAILIAILCIVFTKINKAPKKHKDMVWYRGFNKIIVLFGVPICAAMTVAIILFCTLVFRFPIGIVLGIMSIWGCLFLCSVISITSLFGKDKFGILYYLAGFLNALGIVAICWTGGVVLLIFSAVFAIVCGGFWFSMGAVAKKYY